MTIAINKSMTSFQDQGAILLIFTSPAVASLQSPVPADGHGLHSLDHSRPVARGLQGRPDDYSSPQIFSFCVVLLVQITRVAIDLSIAIFLGSINPRHVTNMHYIPCHGWLYI